MEIFEFFKSISIELAGALIIFALGFLFSNAPKSITKYRLKRFFGSSVLCDDFQIVYGGVQICSDINNQIFEKKYHDGKIYKSKGDYKIISDGGIRAYNYISHELGKHRDNLIKLCSDDIAYTDLNRTYITIGGPLTNELTDLALNEKSNKFFRFANLELVESDELRIDILNNSDNSKFFTRFPGKDYGIILKIRNSRFKNHFFFVCAGISSWGTSGTTWYLANNWKNLYKEFKSKEFGIVLEVNIDSDTSAFRVYP